MADESVPTSSEHITTRPGDLPVRAPTRPQTTPPPAPRPSTAEWIKLEALHFFASLVLAALVFASVYYLGYDVRVGAAAALATVVFGRSVTRHILPDPQSEPAPSTGTAGSGAPPTDTVREIIETIVFVVVLVLLLKSFVAEAFVIPTGSMATTLWGYQKVVTCPECGYTYPVNASTEADPQDGQPVLPVRGCTCPNCRYEIHFGEGGRPDPSWNSGDRVLVAKFLYDLLGKQPERLDVVVFKFPGDSSSGAPWPKSGPFGARQVPMNYIKRLVGESGEVIAIHGGNLYRIPADKVPDEVKEFFANSPKEAVGTGKQLWQSHFTDTKTGEAARRFFEQNQSLFQIIRKPPETMLAMRRIVYDNDHQARDLAEKRWGGEGWSAADKNRTFAHPADGSETDWLTYQHILRRSDGKPQLITDFMGYNTPIFGGPGYGRQSGVNWVPDLMFEGDAVVQKAQGTLTLQLSHGVDRFQARFDLATGNCKLVRLSGDKEQDLGSQPTAMKKPGTYRLRFCDFDNRLTVWVDSALPFGDGVTYTPPAASGPREENDLKRPVSIGSQGAAVRFEHLQVWRDTYYTVGVNGSPGDADAGNVDFSDPNGWRALEDLPYRTMNVQPGHYLCMGDNSPESSDGRTWGLVPDRLLLGRALLVYWPGWPPSNNRMGRIH
jgi:signal peptidase I